MKKLYYVCLLLLGLSISACRTDEACKDIACGPHGNCVEGVCQCDQGYEIGPDANCDVRTAERIARVYSGSTQGCTSGNHNVTLQASNISDEILILVNLGNYSCSNGESVVVEAEILSPTAFTLEPGPYCGKYTFSGEGSISDSEIRINFKAEYLGPGGNQIVDECVAILR